MNTNRLIKAFSVAIVGLALTACASQESYSGQPTPKSSDGPRVVEATPKVQDISDGSGTDGRSERGNILNQRLVFFGYDQSVIRNEDRAVLNAHIDFLTANRDSRVILQGHADERGSTEYNLALGQRRSDAVREYMQAGGVFADQIRAISYGEERPRALGSNESAWAENRRVEIVYGDE